MKPNLSDLLPKEETIFGDGPCAVCGRDPAAGFASIGDKWYCHGDLGPVPTCYMSAVWALATRAPPSTP